jgi:hypothetical protein
MLAATAKTQRFLEITQIVLTFASVCGVVEASRIQWPADAATSYQASGPQQSEGSTDRRVSDLARADRKRREAEQQSSRRGSELGHGYVRIRP